MSIIKKKQSVTLYELTLNQTQVDKLRTLLASVSDADLDVVFNALNKEDCDVDYDLKLDIDAYEIQSGDSVECDVLILTSGE